MRCTKCGKEISSNARFCNECGSDTTQMRKDRFFSVASMDKTENSHTVQNAINDSLKIDAYINTPRDNNSTKRNKLKQGIVIAAVILGFVLIGGVVITKRESLFSRDNKSSKETENIAESSTTSKEKEEKNFSIPQDVDDESTKEENIIIINNDDVHDTFVNFLTECIKYDYYCYYDINRDGLDELLVAGDDDIIDDGSSEYHADNCDIYACNEGEIELIFNNIGEGSDNPLRVVDNEEGIYSYYCSDDFYDNYYGTCKYYVDEDGNYIGVLYQYLKENDYYDIFKEWYEEGFEGDGYSLNDELEGISDSEIEEGEAKIKKEVLDMVEIYNNAKVLKFNDINRYGKFKIKDNTPRTDVYDYAIKDYENDSVYHDAYDELVYDLGMKEDNEQDSSERHRYYRLGFELEYGSNNEYVIMRNQDNEHVSFKGIKLFEKIDSAKNKLLLDGWYIAYDLDGEMLFVKKIGNNGVESVIWTISLHYSSTNKVESWYYMNYIEGEDLADFSAEQGW